MKKECFFTDDAECYIVIGTKLKVEAMKMIQRYEREECGVDNEDLSTEDSLNIEKVKIRISKDKDGEDYYDWSGKTTCEKCKQPLPGKLYNGFVAYI